MKPKEIQDLLDFIAKSGLAEVSIETEQCKIAVKRDSTQGQAFPQVHMTHQVQNSATAHTHSLPVHLPTNVKEDEAVSVSSESSYLTIKSPMIGTFYRSSSPDSDNFANIGDTISKGQTVCIIEAMKLFNEIETEITGRIVKILVENATPVEYDQPLFLVDPS
ncbi:MAG: acetyl-CoA carboxylase biotin carboxyl carrier protein [Opitutaceae bacterium]|nr:acetyl-CoA carboxylase biotin carboxyl carrier protein [Cytophagales bacterium]